MSNSQNSPTVSDGGLNKFQREDFKEGFHVYGEVLCEDCGPIDLSDADDLEEAIGIWNEHVRFEHGVDG